MMTTIKAYACNTVKIYENKPQKIQMGGGGAVLDPPLTNKKYSRKFYELAANKGQAVQVTY